nr:hypothetical protein [Bartonella rattaustraliani]
MVWIYYFCDSWLIVWLQMYVSPWPLMTSFIAIIILTFGNGFLLSLRIALAISSYPQASGVMGALQLGSAALSAAVIGKVSGHDPQIMATLLAACCLLGFIIYIYKARDFMCLDMD